MYIYISVKTTNSFNLQIQRKTAELHFYLKKIIIRIYWWGSIKDMNVKNALF